MKYTFEAKDINVGAYVVQEGYKKNMNSYVKVDMIRMIAYVGGRKDGCCMVSLIDGNIYMRDSTPEQIAEHLNKHNYCPAPHRYLIDALDSWKDYNEFLPEGVER